MCVLTRKIHVFPQNLHFCRHISNLLRCMLIVFLRQFFAQIVNNYILTTPKNLHLECLALPSRRRPDTIEKNQRPMAGGANFLPDRKRCARSVRVRVVGWCPCFRIEWCCRTTQSCRHKAIPSRHGPDTIKKIPHTGDTNSLDRCG